MAYRHDSRGSFSKGDTLRCAIAVGHGLRESLLYGFRYEILQDIAHAEGCSLEIVSISDTVDFTDSIMTGVFDMVSLRHCAADSLSKEGIEFSWSCDGEHVIAISSSKTRALKEINWRLKYLVETDMLAQLRSAFKVGYNPLKLAAEGVRRANLSPYDNLIRKYAANLGWDWRMLAALIYKESKFTINNSSARGAAGLMQVMPSTAAGYGINNLLDPEENIKAGTAYLHRIQDKYFSEGFSEYERENFTLAAYNAGVGRISDCRRLAEELGRNSHVWSEVSEVIPLMKDSELLDSTDVLQHGRFNGVETIAYVNCVREYYDAFCAICP